MIKAEHKKWADLLFQNYLKRLLRKHFYTINILGPVPNFDPQKQLLLLPNHSSWWDGFFIYLLNKKSLHREMHLMMLENQLTENNFFRYLGAYSVQSDSLKAIKESLQYTSNLLNKKDQPSFVCLFPQGELQRWNQRPLVFKRGLDFILKNIKSEIELCFLGIRIEYLGEQRPEVFLKFSKIIHFTPGDSCSLSGFESELTTILDRLKDEIPNSEKKQIIFQGKKSVNEQFRSFTKPGSKS